MVISVSTKREYVPKFNGNDKLPVGEQVKIGHRAATISIKEKVFPKHFSYDADGEVSGSFEIDRQRLLKEFITDILNLSYVTDDELKVTGKITSVDALFKAPPEFEPLIDELYSYFQELLNKKVDEKN